MRKHLELYRLGRQLDFLDFIPKTDHQDFIWTNLGTASYCTSVPTLVSMSNFVRVSPIGLHPFRWMEKASFSLYMTRRSIAANLNV